MFESQKRRSIWKFCLYFCARQVVLFAVTATATRLGRMGFLLVSPTEGGSTLDGQRHVVSCRISASSLVWTNRVS